MTSADKGSLESGRKSARGQVHVFNRIAAKMIDLALVFFVAMILPYPFGPLLGFLYSILGDGLDFKGRAGASLGKRMMGLRVVQVINQRPATWRDSALRNTPVGVATFFAIIPVWGWLIAGLIGLPLMFIEVYLILTVETGHRLGDVMADTEVVTEVVEVHL
jgi:uncharacterized RDD family membrane protein YckC